MHQNRFTIPPSSQGPRQGSEQPVGRMPMSMSKCQCQSLSTDQCQTSLAAGSPAVQSTSPADDDAPSPQPYQVCGKFRRKQPCQPRAAFCAIASPNNNKVGLSLRCCNVYSISSSGPHQHLIFCRSFAHVIVTRHPRPLLRIWTPTRRISSQLPILAPSCQDTQ